MALDKYIRRITSILVLVVLFLVIPVQANEKLVSLEVKGADIRDVLQLLAKTGGVNIVADQSVTGEISVTLNQVPFKEALDLVVKGNGFEYQWVGDNIVVAAVGRITGMLEEPLITTYVVRHITAAEAKKVLGLVLEPSAVVDTKGNTLIVKTLPSQIETIDKIIKSIDVSPTIVEPVLETKTFVLRNIAPDQIIAPLEKVVGTDAIIVPKSRAIVVRGTKEQQGIVADLIASLDLPEESIPPVKTVSPVEEGKPTEVEQLTKVVRLDYATTKAAQQALELVLLPASIRVLQEDRTLAIRGTATELNQALEILAQVDQPVRQVLIEARVEEVSVKALRNLGIDWEGTSGDFTFATESFLQSNVTIGKKIGDILATLKVLEESGDSVMLANPRVAVLDGREAKINIGDRIPIVISQKDEDGKEYTTVEYIEAGVILYVVPRINSQGLIIAQVKPEVSSIIGTTEQGYPEIRTRTVETMMTLTNGETVVIGGLVQEDEIETISKLPLLGDLPLFGKLFQSTKRDKRQTEVVIFLTPRIITTERQEPQP